MEIVLCRVHEQLLLWEGHRDQATLYLSSLANLVEQLNALQRCMSVPGKLGVLTQHYQALCSLHGKLVEAMESRLASVKIERQRMHDVINQLSKCCREGEKQVKLQFVGDCSRSSQTFSLTEQCGWLRLIYAAYAADTEEKGVAVEGVAYTDQDMGKAISVWTRDPPESKEAVDLLKYTVLSANEESKNS